MKKCYGCGMVLPDDHTLCDIGENPLCAKCNDSYLDFVSEEAKEGARQERQWRQYRYGLDITLDGYPDFPYD